MALGSKRSGTTLRGSRLGVEQSGWQYEGVEPADRELAEYECPVGHTYGVLFAAEAEVPGMWPCSKCGQDGISLMGHTGTPQTPGKYITPGKTAFQQLLMRRSPEEGEQIIEQALIRMRRLQSEGSTAQVLRVG